MKKVPQKALKIYLFIEFLRLKCVGQEKIASYLLSESV